MLVKNCNVGNKMTQVWEEKELLHHLKNAQNLLNHDSKWSSEDIDHFKYKKLKHISNSEVQDKWHTQEINW